jgi:phosphoglycolate phosphatase-like HAD superfamily hydrolase
MHLGHCGSARWILALDMIGMNWDDAVMVGDSFEDLLSRLS